MSAVSSLSQRDLSLVRFGMPKGRIERGILDLLSAAGIQLKSTARAYRPELSISGFETKVLKPQDIVAMLHAGSRDVGFAGADWAEELRAELVEVMDTGLDPVRLIVAAPRELLSEDNGFPQRQLTVASEYEFLSRRWINKKGLDATFVRSYGATEVFPPDDADLIVDNTSTGQTLRANGLVIVDEILRSSTRLFANPRAMDDPSKRARIESFALLLKSVIQARSRVMVELNVSAADLDKVIQILPCMRHPTISPLHGDAAYAVKAAVPRADLPTLIPEIKRLGGSDIVIFTISQLVA